MIQPINRETGKHLGGENPSRAGVDSGGGLFHGGKPGGAKKAGKKGITKPPGENKKGKKKAGAVGRGFREGRKEAKGGATPDFSGTLENAEKTWPPGQPKKKEAPGGRSFFGGGGAGPFRGGGWIGGLGGGGNSDKKTGPSAPNRRR